MKSKTTKVPLNVVRITRNHLLKRGLSVHEGKLMDTIFELIAKNKREMLRMIGQKKDYEVKLRKWLDTPIETERTDALKEHDSVV